MAVAQSRPLWHMRDIDLVEPGSCAFALVCFHGYIVENLMLCFTLASSAPLKNEQGCASDPALSSPENINGAA